MPACRRPPPPTRCRWNGARRWDLRRFGFHGLSHSYVARRAAHCWPARPAELRLVSCHLGAGASLAAIVDGRSVDTTMGFTPLDGLVMATRSGSVDPGLVLWLEEHVGMPPAELADALEYRSGLLGLARQRATCACCWRPSAAASREAPWPSRVYLHRLRAGDRRHGRRHGRPRRAGVHRRGGRELGAHQRARRGGPCVPGRGHRRRGATRAPATARSRAAGAACAARGRRSREDLQIAAEVRAVLGARAADGIAADAA